ncbi:MAG TPA: hypothetical protein VFI37_01275 [Gaiellaceae bacterium]|jgi:hypothetical protein|nr:hypothetical protein [Gaiellaceae bacterium]
MRDWLEMLEQGDPVDALPALAYAAGLDVELGDEVAGATRRALLLLAAGGDPHRGLDLNGRAVTALADELDEPDRRVLLAAGLVRLEQQAQRLPNVLQAIGTLRRKPEVAWRAFAAGVLADSLEDDE